MCNIIRPGYIFELEHCINIRFLLELNDRGRARRQTQAAVTPSQMRSPLHHIRLGL